jgi:hypothetical protein
MSTKALQKHMVKYHGLLESNHYYKIYNYLYEIHMNRHHSDMGQINQGAWRTQTNHIHYGMPPIYKSYDRPSWGLE